MRRAILICACALMVAGGCSDSADEPDTSADATTTEAPTTTEAATTTAAAAMQLTSPAFVDEGTIPERYTCDSDDVSPALTLDGMPTDTASLVLVMEDPDAPGGTWDHWVAYDIPVADEIPEDVGALGTSGANSWGLPGYGGPCPPSGTHRYVFTVYALDTNLGLDSGATKAEVLDALDGRVLSEATLMGTYGR